MQYNLNVLNHIAHVLVETPVYKVYSKREAKYYWDHNERIICNIIMFFQCRSRIYFFRTIFKSLNSSIIFPSDLVHASLYICYVKRSSGLSFCKIISTLANKIKIGSMLRVHYRHSRAGGNLFFNK